MPTKGITINSQFTPFSFERYIQPLQQYGEAYAAVEQGLTKLDEQASVWEKLAESEKDKAAYQRYKKYADDLRSQANELATNGLSIGSRAALSKLRGRYSSEIQPIADAWDAREKEIALQKEAMIKNPTVMFNRYAANTGLDTYMAQTPELLSYSGELLRSYSANASKQLAKEIRENPEKWNKILGGQYFSTAHQTGLTDAEILNSLRNEDGTWKPEANQALLAIRNQVLSASGLDKWGNYNDLENSIDDYIEQGYWDAIGETKFDHLQNHAWLENYRARQAAAQQQELIDLAINPKNIYSSRDIEDYTDNVNKYQKYFTIGADGNYKLNDLGKAALTFSSKKVNTGEFSQGVVPSNSNYDLGFATFMKGLLPYQQGTGKKGNSQTVDIASLGDATLSNLFSDYVANHNIDVYDALRETEYGYTHKDGKTMKSNILNDLNGLDLQEVDYNPKTGKYEVTKDALSTSDLNSDDYQVLESRFSIHGNIVRVQDKNGKVKSYQLPTGISPRNETAVNTSLQAAENIRQELNRMESQSGGVYSTAELTRKQLLENAYKQHLRNAYMYYSQLELTNTTENQKFGPYGY